MANARMHTENTGTGSAGSQHAPSDVIKNTENTSPRPARQGLQTTAQTTGSARGSGQAQRPQSSAGKTIGGQARSNPAVTIGGGNGSCKAGRSFTSQLNGEVAGKEENELKATQEHHHDNESSHKSKPKAAPSSVKPCVKSKSSTTMKEDASPKQDSKPASETKSRSSSSSSFKAKSKSPSSGQDHSRTSAPRSAHLLSGRSSSASTILQTPTSGNSRKFVGVEERQRERPLRPHQDPRHFRWSSETLIHSSPSGDLEDSRLVKELRVNEKGLGELSDLFWKSMQLGDERYEALQRQAELVDTLTDEGTGTREEAGRNRMDQQRLVESTRGRLSNDAILSALVGQGLSKNKPTQHHPGSSDISDDPDSTNFSTSVQCQSSMVHERFGSLNIDNDTRLNPLSTFFENPSDPHPGVQKLFTRTGVKLDGINDAPASDVSDDDGSTNEEGGLVWRDVVIETAQLGDLSESDTLA